MKTLIADEIKTRVSMRDACDAYGLTVNRMGFACCPFHGEKTPSMKIYDGDRGFYCFGCGAHGDVIDFVAKYYGIDFLSAAKKINDDLSLGLVIGRKLSDEERAEAEKKILARKIDAELKEAEKKRLYDAYYDSLEKWINLDKIKRQNRPTEPNNIDPLYAYACNNIETARYNVECAEIDLYNFEKKH